MLTAPMVPLALRSGGEKDACARGGDTRRRASGRQWPQSCQKMATAREEVVNEPHVALRGLTTPPPGERPGILPEPVPQRSDRTVRRFAGAALPTPGLPVLVGALGEAVDPSSLSFLVRRAVEDRKREEEEKERKKKEAKEKADLELAKRDPWWAQHLADMKAMEMRRSGIPSSASSSSKRKRKKRSKRKLPKSSSGVPIRRCGQGFRSRSSFSGAQCSRLLTTGPRCSTSWPVRNGRTVSCSSRARLVSLAILHLALCFLPCLQPEMLGVVAGMNQEDTYAVGWFLSAATRIWQSLVRCSPWFGSGYMLRQSTAASVGDC